MLSDVALADSMLAATSVFEDRSFEIITPLKKAKSKDKSIPPDARWTKIDRRLVNPAALEAVGERFEERKDHVIVLRVLTKEDIQRLADKTKDIRGESALSSSLTVSDAKSV